MCRAVFLLFLPLTITHTHIVGALELNRIAASGLHGFIYSDTIRVLMSAQCKTCFDTHHRDHNKWERTRRTCLVFLLEFHEESSEFKAQNYTTLYLRGVALLSSATSVSPSRSALHYSAALRPDMMHGLCLIIEMLNKYLQMADPSSSRRPASRRSDEWGRRLCAALPVLDISPHLKHRQVRGGAALMHASRRCCCCRLRLALNSIELPQTALSW